MTPGSIVLFHPGWLWLLPVLMLIALLWRYFNGQDDAATLFAGGLQNDTSLVHPLLRLIPSTKPDNRQRLILQILL